MTRGRKSAKHLKLTDGQLIAELAQASQLMSFEFDQLEVGRLATDHLIGLWHNRIAHIAGPQNHADANQRK